MRQYPGKILLLQAERRWTDRQITLVGNCSGTPVHSSTTNLKGFHKLSGTNAFGLVQKSHIHVGLPPSTRSLDWESQCGDVSGSPKSCTLKCPHLIRLQSFLFTGQVEPLFIPLRNLSPPSLNCHNKNKRPSCLFKCFILS